MIIIGVIILGTIFLIIYSTKSPQLSPDDSTSPEEPIPGCTCPIPKSVIDSQKREITITSNPCKSPSGQALCIEQTCKIKAMFRNGIPVSIVNSADNPFSIGDGSYNTLRTSDSFPCS